MFLSHSQNLAASDSWGPKVVYLVPTYLLFIGYVDNKTIYISMQIMPADSQKYLTMPVFNCTKDVFLCLCYIISQKSKL